ncbi:hypothetical protein Scep_021342 [Stephania cephalantha]|uniref:Uncharacterized protein n=1 Tax=Stephania cephalantha TaxID=152367 RepID=A0AAP0FAN9_9MAGN
MHPTVDIAPSSRRIIAIAACRCTPLPMPAVAGACFCPSPPRCVASLGIGVLRAVADTGCTAAPPVLRSRPPPPNTSHALRCATSYATTVVLCWSVVVVEHLLGTMSDLALGWAPPRQAGLLRDLQAKNTPSVSSHQYMSGQHPRNIY